MMGWQRHWRGREGLIERGLWRRRRGNWGKDGVLGGFTEAIMPPYKAKTNILLVCTEVICILDVSGLFTFLKLSSNVKLTVTNMCDGSATWGLVDFVQNQKTKSHKLFQQRAGGQSAPHAPRNFSKWETQRLVWLRGTLFSVPKVWPRVSPCSLLNHNEEMNFAERDIEGWTVKCRLQPSMEVPD